MGDGLEGLVGRAVGSAVHVGGTVRSALDHGIADAGTHGQREVRRERPRRRRPRERADAGETQRLGLGPDQREGHGDRGVLTHLVDVVVHAQFVRGQGRLVAPAVRQHAVALVGEALVVERLERPQHALHVGRVQRLVAALEVDPAGLTRDVVLPVARVLEHRLAGLGVEGRHAIASISSFSVMPSCFIASSSAGRPCVSHPKTRSTFLPRIVWKRGKTSFAYPVRRCP